ncbi:MAG: type II secretion system F family protein [Patescibacteria group bacterium]
MPIFNYIIKDLAGKTLTGTVEAPNPTLAGDILRERKYVVISLAEKKEGGIVQQLLQRFQGVKLGEKTIFARQLATMVSSGLPLTNALEILRVQSSSERMSGALGGMLADVQGGTSLAKAMAKHPDIFDKVTVSLVEAGEASGKLDVLLTQLADNMEKEADFRSKTRGALIYPAVIGVAMTGVFIIMMIFVVPRLTALYEDIGAELPLPTRILIAISNLLVNGWWILLVVLGIGGYLGYKYLQTEKGKYRIANFTFKFPIFGKLNKESELARFSRTLGLLIGAGIPITQALEIVAAAMGNILYRDAILAAEKQVEKGVPLSVPIRADPNFDPLVAQMIAVGEETGKLDEVLEKVAGFFEAQAESSIKNLSTALEPIILVILGVMVGGLVLAIITPIYNLTTQF